MVELGGRKKRLTDVVTYPRLEYKKYSQFFAEGKMKKKKKGFCGLNSTSIKNSCLTMEAYRDAFVFLQS